MMLKMLYTAVNLMRETGRRGGGGGGGPSWFSICGCTRQLQHGYLFVAFFAVLHYICTVIGFCYAFLRGLASVVQIACLVFGIIFGCLDGF